MMVPQSSPKDRFFSGTIGSRTIMLLRTGVGPQKTQRRLIETEWGHRPQCILSIGCAGALSPDLKVGDAIIPERIINSRNIERRLVPSPDLIEAARNCCKELGVPFHSGATVSTPNVAATRGQKKVLAEESGAIAVDMESAQVAEWAEECDVPMLAIRTISDALGDGIPPEASTIVDTRGRLVVRKLLVVLLSNPLLFIELLRLKRNLDLSFSTLEKIVKGLMK
jgi:adenosylhomocysteine nucleosidase